MRFQKYVFAIYLTDFYQIQHNTSGTPGPRALLMQVKLVCKFCPAHSLKLFVCKWTPVKRDNHFLGKEVFITFALMTVTTQSM